MLVTHRPERARSADQRLRMEQGELWKAGRWIQREQGPIERILVERTQFLM
jgi:ABC-type transport system involved in cytochrome bd biosynthesis fused ATPase/permease subunit